MVELSSSVMSGVAGSQTVADSTLADDVVRRPGVVAKLRTQPPDVFPQRIGAGRGVEPDSLENQTQRQGLTGIEQKQTKESRLGRSQMMDLVTIADQAAA